MLGGADNPNGELPSYITGANTLSVTRAAILAPLLSIVTTSGSPW